MGILEKNKWPIKCMGTLNKKCHFPIETLRMILQFLHTLEFQ